MVLVELQLQSFAMSGTHPKSASILTLEDSRRGLSRPAPPPEGFSCKLGTFTDHYPQ